MVKTNLRACWNTHLGVGENEATDFSISRLRYQRFSNQQNKPNMAFENWAHGIILLSSFCLLDVF
jgi:hypothetical protein